MTSDMTITVLIMLRNVHSRKSNLPAARILTVAIKRMSCEACEYEFSHRDSDDMEYAPSVTHVGQLLTAPCQLT